MIRLPWCRRVLRRWGILGLCGLAWAGLAWAGPPPMPPAALPQPLPLDAAVAWALRNNPELAAFRQQRGVAVAGVVIARTYPFNPVWEARVDWVTGPESAGISNRVNNEHRIFMDWEVRGQGRYRRQAACAALSRTDWEIAGQELNLAIRVVRAFDTVLYRREKLNLVQETIRLNEQAADQVRRLVDQGKLRPADLIVIRTEVEAARGQSGLGRTNLITPEYDLRRALGVFDPVLTLQGRLTIPAPPSEDAALLLQTAVDRRPDLHARQAALQEATARLRLEIANRYGNPSIGPVYQFDPTRINFIGGQLVLPLPVLNTHRGEILQREAERTRAALDLRQTEVLIQHDLEAALARLQAARAWLNYYETQVLPNLRTSLEDIERLLAQGEPGVDVLRVIDIRRKLLGARDNYLDALWEISQAQADLAAAVGDPGLALGLANPNGSSTPAPAWIVVPIKRTP